MGRGDASRPAPNQKESEPYDRAVDGATEYDLEGVEPTFHPIGDLSNVMREDAEAPGFTQAEALANAPRQQDGSFLIPSILGEGGDR